MLGSRTLVALAAALLAAGCGGDGTTTAPTASTTAPSATGAPSEPATGAPDDLRITASAPDEIDGNVVTIDLETSGIEIVPADGDTSGATGHYHVFIDTDPVEVGEAIPTGERNIVHSATEPIDIYGLNAGGHTFSVVLGDGAHTRIHGDVVSEVTTNVNGPWLQATLNDVEEGSPLSVTVYYEGFDIVEAAGDTSGETGHLQVYIDEEPHFGGGAAHGDNIIHTTDTTIELPELEPGRHDVWVVAADGAHVPFDPKVADRLTINVE